MCWPHFLSEGFPGAEGIQEQETKGGLCRFVPHTLGEWSRELLQGARLPPSLDSSLHFSSSVKIAICAKQKFYFLQALMGYW